MNPVADQVHDGDAHPIQRVVSETGCAGDLAVGVVDDEQPLLGTGLVEVAAVAVGLGGTVSALCDVGTQEVG